MKIIAKFFLDCGRMGDLEGIFTSTKEELDSIYGKDVYFGEVLGKHSEISITLEPNHIKIISDDQDFIDKFEKILGSGTISGYNPFDYIDFDEQEDDD